MLVRRDDRHHPLLRLAHQDLGRGQARVAQRDRVHVDAHAAVAARRQLGGRAGDAGRAQVLDALDQPLGVQLEAALDQQLLQERVADLDRRALGGLAAGVRERRAGQHRRAADAVRPGPRAEQHDLVAGAAGHRRLQVAVPHEAHAERVDQRVACVAGVEDELAADVGQAEAVAVERDARDDARQHPGGVVRVGRAEPERVHDRDRARAHRDDVPDDAADAGRRALVRLDEGRVVVALDLEGDRVALADVHHARVGADAGQQVPRLVGVGREVAQVHLGRLVRAVLAPHDRVQGQLGGGRPAAEDLADLRVLVVGEAELLVGLLLVGRLLGDLDGVLVAHCDSRPRRPRAPTRRTPPRPR